jgi:hypothetical protein
VSLLSASKFAFGGKPKKKILFASKGFTTLASGKVRLDLILSDAAFGLLQQNRRIKVTANVVQKGAGGTPSTTSRSLTLIAPKPPPG